MTASNSNTASTDLLGSGLLVVATIGALLLANLPTSTAYASVWHLPVGPLSVEHWLNDGLMAIFFLLIGLELERALYVGHLSQPRKALLPIVAAIGGMAFPALIHYALNHGTSTQPGFGIPMATDIAFALGVLTLLRNHIPVALKVFVIAFAVIDDLGAIIVIATFYTGEISAAYLFGAIALWSLLLILNLHFRVMSLAPYLIGGVVMWVLMHHSGVHATLAGVMLAFAIPFRSSQGDASPSAKLEHALHKPVLLVVLPLFALANAGIPLSEDWLVGLASANAIGITTGLIMGKPIGVFLFSWLAVRFDLCRLPRAITWSHIAGAGLLGGIGFTMSIFIANLAFQLDPATINASKIAVLLASLIAGSLAAMWLRLTRPVIAATSD
jgi:Na+:H+ antiporter, NhaA family